MASPQSFKIKFGAIRYGIFIPKYYSPKISESLRKLSATHSFLTLKDLKNKGLVAVDSGDEIGKMAYGTGPIPFVRTSDISNWEIKTDPKHCVSEEIYKEYSEGQDVNEGDIFFVRDGTYLIGQTCMVTKYDLPCLYQSHILKIRVSEKSHINRYLLFALLNLPIVKDQIRSMQFTADIIDTIGNRIFDVVLPVPKDEKKRQEIEEKIKMHIGKRVKLKQILNNVPLYTEGLSSDLSERPSQKVFDAQKTTFSKIFLTRIHNSIFIPKYYDVHLAKDIRILKTSHELVSIGELVQDKVVIWNTGIEVGKMAYGTGSIPFIRTSDITNWELKADPKQGVSEEIYLENKQDILPEDIFVVRDGTYLVGTSCILTDADTKILYCGGLYKLRVQDPIRLNPYLLIALLNMPIVRRQMRARQFTRDVIDTLGRRLFEIVVPIPKDGEKRDRIVDQVRHAILDRIKLREVARDLMDTLSRN